MPLFEAAKVCAIMERTIDIALKPSMQGIFLQVLTLGGRGALRTLTTNRIKNGMHRICTRVREKAQSAKYYRTAINLIY